MAPQEYTLATKIIKPKDTIEAIPTIEYYIFQMQLTKIKEKNNYCYHLTTIVKHEYLATPSISLDIGIDGQRILFPNSLNLYFLDINCIPIIHPKISQARRGKYMLHMFRHKIAWYPTCWRINVVLYKLNLTSWLPVLDECGGECNHSLTSLVSKVF